MNSYEDETDCYVLFNPWCRGACRAGEGEGAAGSIRRNGDSSGRGGRKREKNVRQEESIVSFFSYFYLSCFLLILLFIVFFIHCFTCKHHLPSSSPWTDDAVFLDDEEKREEYVLNEQGKVYVGAYRRSRGRPWAFGQFDDVVLPVAVYLLEISRIADPERGNPVKVVRGISAGVSHEEALVVLCGGVSQSATPLEDTQNSIGPKPYPAAPHLTSLTLFSYTGELKR